MRVLYLLRYYPTLTETFVTQEIREVAARGIEVEIAALGTRADGALQDMAPVVPLHSTPRRCLGWQLRSQTPGQRWLASQQRPKDAARLPALAALAAGFDRIHVHFAGEAAEVAHALHMDLKIPYTVTVHATDLFRARPSLTRVLEGAQQVLTISSLNQATLEAMSITSTVVRCGPDLNRLKPVPMPDGPLHALFIGRSVPKKGLDTLLEAWSGLDRPDARLSVVTDAPLRAPPPGVEQVGLIPPSEIPARLADAHLLVLPCRRAPDGDMDGIPLVLMEAMAMGRPVLTTPVSGIPELVDGLVGWLVPADDPRALRRELQSVTDDLGQASAKGAGGAHRLRERGYHLEAQVDGVVAVWEGCGRSTPGMAACSSEIE